MFIPLHDANTLKHIKLQYVTLSLIALNIVVYLVVNVGLAGGVYQAAVVSFGYIPAVVNDVAELPPSMVYIPEELSLVSYSFLHGGFMHLASNMLFLWVFGDNVEDALGHLRYLFSTSLCAVAGALAHGFLVPDSTAPLIGASGAISGVIGAYLMLHPKVRIWVLAFGRIPLRLPAAIPLGAWIVYQLAAVAVLPRRTCPGPPMSAASLPARPRPRPAPARRSAVRQGDRDAEIRRNRSPPDRAAERRRGRNRRDGDGLNRSRKL
jgi:membrane associated rhomboid family serine protease